MFGVKETYELFMLIKIGNTWFRSAGWNKLRY